MKALGHELRVHGLRLVLYVDDLGELADLELRQRPAQRRRDLAAGGRNRIAVRIVARIPHARGQRFGLGGRSRVLEALGLVVPSGRVEARLVGQVALPQTVDADDAQGVAAPLAGQPVLPVLDLDQLLRLQPAQDLRRAIARHRERAGHALQGSFTTVVLEVEEVLEGVLDQHPLRRAQRPQATPEPAAHRPEQKHRGRGQRERDRQRD